EYWSNSEEVVKAVLGVIEKCFEDPELRAVGEGLGKTVSFNYSDPDSQVWIKSLDGGIEWGEGQAPSEPDVELSLSADDGHKVWCNKLNLLMAIGRKKIKIKGNPAQLLKLAPMIKKATPHYYEVLREMGKESIIL
ncbi:MAG: SCP2 sterol-binding domain-containing protein, partial [Bacteroidetes bacterium]|nr:SCP2 sterol-binding domain-containing protein [Bacteroidota bacterium]